MFEVLGVEDGEAMGKADLDEIEWTIRRRLAGRPRKEVTEPGLRRAAVLLALLSRGGEVAVLLTRRTEVVEHHKGQISLPGGTADPADRGPVDTALREAEEELGIPRGAVQVLGLLDDVVTVVSGFVITPVVGTLREPVALRVNAAEIAEVLTVPLRTFTDPQALRIERRLRDGRWVEVLSYRYGPHEVWGATARVLKGFVDAVFGTDPPPPARI
ncbi:MAG: CoA pyrophosphatase [Armatimonadota bacterium]|nr:CoA pyrophosphatase [Armatimonadota bacterium]MDR7403726.1 CoA pyrophosphatase [Armatimonadota bacterium]